MIIICAKPTIIPMKITKKQSDISSINQTSIQQTLEAQKLTALHLYIFTNVKECDDDLHHLNFTLLAVATFTIISIEVD